MHTDLPRTVLFLFAHQDDEFFCLPWIAKSVTSGHVVACAYLTNGGYGGQSVERRVAESVAVLKGIGVDAANVHFPGVDLAIPDGALHRHAEKAFEWLDAFHRRYRPSETVVPAWEGGHHDHDAVFAITAHLSASLGPDAGRFRQFALYNGFHTPLFRVMHPLDANGPGDRVKISVGQAASHLRHIFSYPSQWKTWLGLFPFTVWRLVRSRSFYLQDMDPRRAGERPHPGPLLYERRGFASYDDVTATINSALAIHSGQTQATMPAIQQ